MFQPVKSRVNFPEVEEKILDFWKTNDIFKRSIENRRDGPRFTLYEGPPTANGSPGIHHVISRILKDIFPRYWTMKGYYTPRIGGWDTHGLPVELEIEKELGFSGKAQIEEYGIERFNALCRQSARGYIKEFEDMTERIAFWVDLPNAYVTMENSYIEIIKSQPDILEVRFERCPFDEVMREYNLTDLTHAFCLSDYAFTEALLPGVELHRTHEIAKGDKFCDHKWIFHNE